MITFIEDHKGDFGIEPIYRVLPTAILSKVEGPSIMTMLSNGGIRIDVGLDRWLQYGRSRIYQWCRLYQISHLV